MPGGEEAAVKRWLWSEDPREEVSLREGGRRRGTNTLSLPRIEGIPRVCTSQSQVNRNSWVTLEGG